MLSPMKTGELILTLHWKGDAPTELRMPRRHRGQCSTQTSRESIEGVAVLARICSDNLIVMDKGQGAAPLAALNDVPYSPACQRRNSYSLPRTFSAQVRFRRTELRRWIESAV